MMASLLLINGPNRNLLGTRRPGVYGDQGQPAIEQQLADIATELDHDLASFQSNAKHEIVDRIQAKCEDGTAFIILNPGAYTHTSTAIRDALLAMRTPFIEIHLSNDVAREEFRQSSYFSDIARACIFGLGAHGYELALLAASRYLSGGK